MRNFTWFSLEILVLSIENDTMINQQAYSVKDFCNKVIFHPIIEEIPNVLENSHSHVWNQECNFHTFVVSTFAIWVIFVIYKKQGNKVRQVY